MSAMKEPATFTEWQEAMDAAQGALHLESARHYGLVSGGPEVNTKRCEKLLARGKALGYVPRPEAIENFIRGLARNFR